MRNKRKSQKKKEESSRIKKIEERMKRKLIDKTITVCQGRKMRVIGTRMNLLEVGGGVFFALKYISVDSWRVWEYCTPLTL
jgi:hypothetical protein